MAERLAKRVLLIGWDAADWQIINQLLGQKKLPALERLIETGARGNLATLQPALSPMLWTSIATGKRADKHGIHGFLEPIPNGSGVRPVSSTSRKCKAIWNIANQNHLRSLVVGWYATHPAEPIHGVMVSDRFLSGSGKPLENGVSPAVLTDDLAQYRVDASEITPEDLVPFIPRLAEMYQAGLSSQYEKSIGSVAKILSHSASIQATATQLMLTEEWDFAAVYYDGLDLLCHCFMPYHPPYRPSIPLREFEIFQNVVSGGYRFFDMMLESILAHAGSETTVILVSDHGFKSDNLRPRGDGWERPIDWHRQMGIAIAAGPGIERGEIVNGGTVLDIAPTVLHLLGMAVGRDMDGRPWLEILESRTSAESVDSWDGVDGDAGLHHKELREDPIEALAMIKQLVDLGYVAPLSDDVQTTIQQTVRDNQINLALSLLGSPLPARARPIIEELLEQNPDDALIQSMAARLELVNGNAAKVRELAMCSSALGGRTVTVIGLLAEAAILDEDDEEAVRLFREAISLFEKDSPVSAIYCRLGDTLARLERYDEADRAFHQILEIDPDHAPAWVGLSKLSIRTGDFLKAVEFATHAVSLIHFYPEAHLRLGEALAAADRKEDAVIALEVCATLSPMLPRCIDLLANLKHELGHSDAEMYAERAKACQLLKRGY
jgi:predicted AlkP superfamily phosphohydrolase/phosphomutase/tetratricopeptide (TPR) repeat protein